MSQNYRSQLRWRKGFDGCETPHDLGWKHATEEKPCKPGCYMTGDEYGDYRDGYREADRINR
jgi:hypothetical protein